MNFKFGRGINAYNNYASILIDFKSEKRGFFINWIQFDGFIPIPLGAGVMNFISQTNWLRCHFILSHSLVDLDVTLLIKAHFLPHTTWLKSHHLPHKIDVTYFYRPDAFDVTFSYRQHELDVTFSNRPHELNATLFSSPFPQTTDRQTFLPRTGLWYNRRVFSTHHRHIGRNI